MTETVIPFVPRSPAPSDEAQRIAWRAYASACVEHEQRPSIATATLRAATFAAWVNLFLTTDRRTGGSDAAR